MAQNNQDGTDPADGDEPVKRRRRKFNPRQLDKSLIALPLLKEMKKKRPPEFIDVIIDVNLSWPDGRNKAREEICRLIEEELGRSEAVHRLKTESSQQYVFASLSPEEIRKIAEADLRQHPGVDSGTGPSPSRAIHKIWLDHEIGRLTSKSISTVKADAARTAFGALGQDIVWAVLDTGVDDRHPHFRTHETLAVKAPLEHRDFTTSGSGGGAETKGGRLTALIDKSGHGTHVAGIIAGEFEAGPAGRPLGAESAELPGRLSSTIYRYREDGSNRPLKDIQSQGKMTGMAPSAKILSLKVLDDKGGGKASNIIAALEYIQQLNSYGRLLLVHGVNLSVGYGFDPAWFACGQSPVCVEVDRLVRSGVVVVAAAGNTGYGFNQPASSGPSAAGLGITINDPGNADLAITVGATHRDPPHMYGVSYFSSKGPTGDGRLKPDVVAPGERILSCLSGDKPAAEPLIVDEPETGTKVEMSRYIEDSGTSMAAPHVSGVIAAFLSVRREFIGQPLRVKEIFMSTATDLNRGIYFQGRGLVDLMRAIQSV